MALALAALLGPDAAVGAGGVHEADHGPAELLGLAHEAQGLAVALGVRHAEVAAHTLLGGVAALDGDHGHDALALPGDAGHDGGVVGVEAVSVKLDEPVPAALEQLQRGGALRGARELDDVVGALGRRRALGGARPRPRRGSSCTSAWGAPAAGTSPLCRASSSEIVATRSLRSTMRSQKPCSSRNSERWKPAGSFLVRGLLDHARAGKGHERARLGEDDVALHGKARSDAAGGGVGEHGQVEQARLGVAPNGRGDLGHLHERGRALLHAGAAGDREAHDRQAELGGALEGPRDLLAHDRAHRAHHEVGVHEEEGAVVAAHRAPPADHGVVLVALLARGLELLHVAGELQEVRGREARVPFLEGAGVHRHAHALAPRRRAGGVRSAGTRRGSRQTWPGRSRGGTRGT